MIEYNQKYKIIYSKFPGGCILEILKNYNLDERTDVFLSKIEKKELLNGELLRLIVEDIVLGKNKKEELPVLLQSRFNISQQKALEMAKEVEEKLLILAQKVSEEKAENFEAEEDNTLPKIKAPTSIKEDFGEKIPMSRKINKEKLSKIEEIIKSPQQKKPADKYREPL